MVGLAAQIEKSRKAALAAAAEESQSEAGSPHKKPSKARPKLSQFEFAPGSAQYWVSRSTADGILLPRDTRSILAKCLYLSMLNYVGNRKLKPVDRNVIRM